MLVLFTPNKATEIRMLSMSVVELFVCLPSNFKKIVKSGECPPSCKERGRYPSRFTDVRGG